MNSPKMKHSVFGIYAKLQYILINSLPPIKYCPLLLFLLFTKKNYDYDYDNCSSSDYKYQRIHSSGSIAQPFAAKYHAVEIQGVLKLAGGSKLDRVCTLLQGDLLCAERPI